MRDNVAQSREPAPIDLGMFAPQPTPQTLRRLGQCLQVAKHGVLRLYVSEKRFFPLSREGRDPGYALLDVNQIEAIIFHNGVASLRIRSRAYQ